MHFNNFDTRPLLNNLYEIWELGTEHNITKIGIKNFLAQVSESIEDIDLNKERLQQQIKQIANEIFNNQVASNPDLEQSIQLFTRSVSKLNSVQRIHLGSDLMKIVHSSDEPMYDENKSKEPKPMIAPFFTEQSVFADFGRDHLFHEFEAPPGYTPHESPPLFPPQQPPQNYPYFDNNSTISERSISPFILNPVPINDSSLEALMISYYLEQIRKVTIRYPDPCLLSKILEIFFKFASDPQQCETAINELFLPLYETGWIDKEITSIIEKIGENTQNICAIFSTLNIENQQTLENIKVYIKKLMEQDINFPFISEESTQKALSVIKQQGGHSKPATNLKEEKSESNQLLVDFIAIDSILSQTIASLFSKFITSDLDTFSRELNEVVVQELCLEAQTQALEISSTRGDEIRLKILSSYDKNGYSFIHHAMLNCDHPNFTIDKIKFLIEQGVDVNQLTQQLNIHPLVLFYENNKEKNALSPQFQIQLNMVALLLEHGAFIPPNLCNYFLFSHILSIDSSFLSDSIDLPDNLISNVLAILKSGALTGTNYVFPQKLDQESQEILQRMLLRIINKLSFPVLALGFTIAGQNVTDSSAVAKLITSTHQLKKFIDQFKTDKPEKLEEFLNLTLSQVQRHLKSYHIQKELTHEKVNHLIYDQLIESENILTQNLELLSKVAPLTLKSLCSKSITESLKKDINFKFKVSEIVAPYTDSLLNQEKERLKQ